MADYHSYKRDTLGGLERIGRAITYEQAARRMTPVQRKRLAGKNMMSDDVWQYRLIADGALVVEVAYSWFVRAPLFGLTVFCVGPLSADAEAWDHSLSGAEFSPEDVVSRVATLNMGGRERISVLAAAG